LNKNPNPELKGVLRQLDCLEGWARVTVESEGKQLALKIIDPSGVIIRGKPGATVSFDCGPQPGQPVLIQYAAEPDAKAGTIGRILVIEFLQPPAPVKK
jgi:hypothetical protein